MSSLITRNELAILTDLVFGIIIRKIISNWEKIHKHEPKSTNSTLYC